jgi:PKD repeat protein
MLTCTLRATRIAAVAALSAILIPFCGLCVQIDVLSGSKEGAPGSFVTHVFGLTNDSSHPATYSLVLLAPSGWGALGPPASLTLPPGEEDAVFVTVTIPPGAGAGSYEVQLAATSLSDPLDQATASAAVVVTPMNEIELLAPTGASIAPGRSMTYTFVLVNRGNIQDSFILSATSSRRIPATLSHRTTTLAPQERFTFTVQLDVGTNIAAGRDVLTVTAQSTLFDHVVADAVVFTSILPPSPDAVGGTLMEELPLRVRWSMGKDVLRGGFDSQFSFSTSGQVLGGTFDSFVSLQDPFGPSPARIGSFSMRYLRDQSAFAIGNVSQQLTDLLRLSCVGGSFTLDGEYYGLSVIGGGDKDETRFAGFLAIGPDAAHVGIGYLGIRDPISVSRSAWTAVAYARPLVDWTITLEGSLGMDGPLTSRALSFNTTFDSSSYFFSGSAFSVGTHFPGHRADSAGLELSQRLRLASMSLSTSLSHRWDNVIRNPLHPTRIQDELGINLTATPLEDGPTLTSILNFTWDRHADVSVKDELTTLLSIGLAQTDGVFPYSLSGKVLDQLDRAMGSHVRATTYAEGAGLSLDDFYLYFQLTQQQTLDMMTDTALSSSSDLSIIFRPKSARHEANVTFRSERDDFDLSSSLWVLITDNLDIVFDASISWDRHDAGEISFGWGITFNASVTLAAPFFVTKGRLEGRAFIDRDGDGRYGLNDDLVGNLVVSAGETKVSTDADGYFRFPPLYPADVVIATEGLPAGAASGAPIRATVTAGSTQWVDVPLRPVVVVPGDVFMDDNRNGVRDVDEGGVPQVRVVLRPVTAPSEATATDAGAADAYTDTSGSFVIRDVLPGNYILSLDPMTLPDRFEFTTPEEATVLIEARTPAPVSFGGFVRERQVIVTFQPPTADFVYDPEQPVAGLPLTLDGTTSFDFDGEIVSYAWDFDEDGLVDSTDAVTQHTFPDAGTYRVALTVTDNAGNADTIVREIRVAAPTQSLPDPDTATQLPIASFVVSPSRPTVGDAVSFNGTASLDLDGRIVSFAWDFNEDGITDSAAPIAQYSFSSPGVRNVTLTVTDDSGNTDSVTVPIDVAPQASPPVGVIPPIADFAYAPAGPEPGDVVRFNATLSADPDGQVVAFAWDFNEDGIIDSTAAVVDHVFPEAGQYNVSLTVTDNSGSTDTLTLQVVVGSPEDDSSPPQPSSGLPPIAAFEYSPANPRVDGPVRFQATLSTDPDGRITSYAWDFDGDGTIDSEAAIAEYVFLSEGVVDVSLTVTDDAGNTDTLTQQIVVVEAEASQEPSTSLPPVADFEISPVSPVAGQLVLFNGLLSSDADGEISAYEWDFNGDGVIDSTDAFSEYVFPSAGTYNVALTVTDDSGNSDTFIRAILVDAASSAAPPPSSFQPPVADFTYMPSQPEAGELVLFDGTSSWDFDGEIVAYSWDFNGDGQPDATTAAAEHIFPQPGTMVVSLTVTDNSGASDTLGLPIEVQ